MVAIDRDRVADALPLSVSANAATRKHHPIGFPGRLTATTRPTRPKAKGSGSGASDRQALVLDPAEHDTEDEHGDRQHTERERAAGVKSLALTRCSAARP